MPQSTEENNQKTPLHLAVIYGREGIAKALIENGAGIDKEAGKNKFTPLHLAAYLGQQAVAKLLIEALIKQGKRAAINAKDKDERTPLHVAAGNGHQAVIELLIENGADVNAKNKDKKTPLYLTAENCDQAVMELLINNGADVNAKDNQGWPPLYWATIGSHQPIMELLINSGAEINAEIGEIKWTLLHHAASDGCLERVKFLVEKGANVKLKACFGKTPLDLANLGLRRSAGGDSFGERFKNRLHKLSNRGPGEPPAIGRHQEVISFLRLAAKNRHHDKSNNESAETSFRCNIC